MDRAINPDTFHCRYLFDLDHWHISQPPADLAEIDPEGAALAMEVARQLCKDEEKEGTPDKIEGASLFTVDAFHWGVSDADFLGSRWQILIL